MLNLRNTVNKIGFWGRKHSPELLIAGAIVSGIGAIATAIIATVKLNKVVEPCNKNIEEIKISLIEHQKENNVPAIKEDKKLLALAYGRTALKIAALYAPSALLFATSVACNLGSHKIMKGRNLALAAACTTLDSSYKAYRERVKEKLGEEAEEKIYQGTTKKKITVKDPETGKEETKTIKGTSLENHGNAWDVMFDESSRCWEPNATRNFEFLAIQQRTANYTLRMRGYIFLYEVYELLGITKEVVGDQKWRAAHYMGWMFDPEDNSRDSFVDFGICEPKTDIPTKKTNLQLTTNEPSFWLNMNVDGDILSGNDNKRVFTETVKRGY